MSHKATSWAILQRGLKPAARVVLWYLADHHNPVDGCFPGQDTLANECEMSVRSVRNHLDTLESAGLIRRVKVDRHGRRRRSDRYILGFEDDFSGASQRTAADEEAADMFPERGETTGETVPNPAPARHCNTGNSASKISAPGANTGKSASETPANSGEKHRQDLPPNLVREPVREPCVGGASAAQIEKSLEDFLEAHPRPRDREACRRELEELVGQGVELADIVTAAKRYAAENDGNKRMYLAYADNWLRNRRWEDHQAPTAAPTGRTGDGERDIAEFWAATIKRGGYVPSGAISNTLARNIVERGLVEVSDLQRIGVQV